VQSYAGLMEFGLTACRRALSQEESHEMVNLLQEALREIQNLETVEPGEPARPIATAASTSLNGA
jgi:diacylglycerol O-acyltransferase / wax synthase